MRILVTNDDGIDAIGLHTLARAMRSFGEVVVAAPDAEYSGAGAALGALHLIEPTVTRRDIDGLTPSDGIEAAWAVSGPPALCVFFARLGVFGAEPDLVVSGINPGANVGRAVYHSGTVGAALTARNGHINSVAVSQDVSFGAEGQSFEDAQVGQHWDAAAEIGRLVVEALIESPGSEPAVINVNVPNTPIEQMAGWRICPVGWLPSQTMTTATLEPIATAETGGDGDAPANEAYRVELGWGERVALDPTTDGGAVQEGVVALSWLSRMDHDARQDVTAVTTSLGTRLSEAPSA